MPVPDRLLEMHYPGAITEPTPYHVPVEPKPWLYRWQQGSECQMHRQQKDCEREPDSCARMAHWEQSVEDWA